MAASSTRPTISSSSGRSSTRRSKQIPWGISEAAYNGRDREMTYQYTNFGVPGLGLKRGLAQNTVIAPYATILAAQFMPREAIDNLRRLAADRRDRAATASTTPSTSPRSGCRKATAAPSSTTTWPTIPGHVDRRHRQRDVRGPHARPLPQRPGHRGGRTPARRRRRRATSRSPCQAGGGPNASRRDVGRAQPRHPHRAQPAARACAPRQPDVATAIIR